MQEADHLPATLLSKIALVAFVVGAGATVVASRLGRIDGAEPRKNAAAPPPIGTVERSNAAHADRGDRARAEQTEILSHYGWVDRAHGVARIPIDRAMDLVVERAKK